tara:strand:- start:10 stop:933 length:924 start_codon:yes stop_codon:yes gene_type:complete
MKPIAVVFGCTGQDGSYLCKSLLNKDFLVYGVSRKNKPNLTRLLSLDILDKVQLISSNLENFGQTVNTIKKLQPNEIYNLSAQSSVGDSFKKPVETQKSIVNSTVNLLEACRQINFKGNIFLAGSSEMFGSTNSPADLNSKIDIRSPYAAAKYQSYILTKMYRELYKLKCVSGILFNHESPLRDERFVIKKIITTAIRIKNGSANKLKIGDISIKRDWGYAEEYVEAMQLINRSVLSKDYIICTGESISLQKIIEKVFNELDLNWQNYTEVSENFIRSNEIKNSIGNPDQMLAELGCGILKNLFING